MFGDSLWAIVVVLGFVVLGGAIAFAKFKNKTTPSEDARTAQATKDMYREQSAEDRTRTP